LSQLQSANANGAAVLCVVSTAHGPVDCAGSLAAAAASAALVNSVRVKRNVAVRALVVTPE